MRRWLLLLLSCSLSCAAVAAPPPATPDRLPTSAFAQLPFVEQAHLSPSGTRLAGIFGLGGVQSVLIMPLIRDSNPDEHSFRMEIPDGVEIDWVRWANEDFLLAGLRQRHSDLELDFYVTRLLVIDRVKRGITRPLWNLNGQNVSDVVWKPAVDGDNRILLAGQDSIFENDEGLWPSVYEVSLANGRGRIVQRGRAGVTEWVADNAGVVRLGIGFRPSALSWTVSYRSRGNDSFKLTDVADTRKGEGVIRPMAIRSDSDIGFALHLDDKGKSGLWEYDIARQADVKLIAASEALPIDGAILSADGSTVIGVTQAHGPTRWLDPALAELQAQFDKSVPGRTADIISLSRDRSRMLVEVGAPDTPGLLYYFDTSDGVLHKVALVNEAIGARHLAPVRLVRYKARDGLDIEAVLTLPAGREPRDLPLVVLPHGGPWANDEPRYDYWTQFLANRGYAVIQPNFRGSTGYGSAFERKGEGQMGLAMQDDISDAVRWAVSQGIANAGRVCIVGAFYLGYAAMWGIVKDPGQYRCAISIAGVSNVRRDVNDFGTDLLGKLYTAQWTAMAPDFAAVSPSNFVEKIKAPLLLIHGQKDVRVDYHQSQRMFDKMTKAGKTVEYVLLPKADHNFGRQADRQALLEAMEGFLARYNPS